MLRKLMKHELRATGRVMGPLLALVLVAAVGGNISTYRLLESGNSVLNTLGILLLTGFMIAIAAASIMAFVLMVQRFYKNLLRDEGYLSMTLPVSVHEHIWAKLLTTLIWWVAVTLAVAAAIFILVFNGDTLREIGKVLANLQLGDLNVTESLAHCLLFCLELVLLLLVGCAGICLHFYAALSVGYSFTHHKDALSAAGYFGMSIVLYLLQSGASRLLNLLGLHGIRLWMQSLAPITQMHLTLLSVTAAMGVTAALYYAVTAYFLKNRLNLG